MKRFALQCDCIGGCTILTILEFEEFTDSKGNLEPQEFSYEFYTAVSQQAPFWWRVKKALKLTFKPNYFYGDALTFSRDGAERLRDFLNECLDESKVDKVEVKQ